MLIKASDSDVRKQPTSRPRKFSSPGKASEPHFCMPPPLAVSASIPVYEHNLETCQLQIPATILKSGRNAGIKVNPLSLPPLSPFPLPPLFFFLSISSSFPPFTPPLPCLSSGGLANTQSSVFKGFISSMVFLAIHTWQIPPREPKF